MTDTLQTDAGKPDAGASAASKESIRRMRLVAVQEYQAERWEQALELYRWLLPHIVQTGDIEDECRVRNNIASCLFHLGRLDESIALCRTIILVVKAALGDTHSLVGKCARRIEKCRIEQNDMKASRLFQEGRSLYARGDYRGAYKHFDECLKYKSDKTDQQWLALRLMNMALCRYGMKHWKDASALILQAEKLVDVGAFANDETNFELFYVYLRRIRVSFEASAVYGLLEDYDRYVRDEDFVSAQEVAEEALKEVDACHVGRECYLGARALECVAYAVYRQTRYDVAAKFYKEALWLANRWAAREDGKMVARIRNMLGRCS